MISSSNKNAPFGVRSTRFGFKGIHPGHIRKSKMQIHLENDYLGPGSYDHDISSNRKGEIALVEDSNWSRAAYVEQFSKMPMAIHSHLIAEKKRLKVDLGPGTYNVKELKSDKLGKLSSLQSKTKRFNYGSGNSAPGTFYGIGGIPHTLKDQKDMDRKHPSKFGTMCKGRPSSLSKPKNTLCPCDYEMATSSIDQLLNKTTGKLGPYRTFTINRGAPIKTGHYATVKSHNLRAGLYDIIEVSKRRDEKRLQYQGRFGKGKFKPPLEGVNSYSLAKSLIGPGSYDPRNPYLTKSNFSVKDTPFMFNTSREKSAKFSRVTGFQSGGNISPGRYRPEKYESTRSCPSIKFGVSKRF